jgi:hypothetical protein
MDAVREGSGDVGERDHFIPARKIDIVDAILAEGTLGDGADADKFRQFCRLLGAVYHYEYFDRLERLRNDYFYFSPDTDSRRGLSDAALERAYRELIETLKGVLHNANFIEIPHDEINQAHREHALVQVTVEAPRDNYRDVMFFRRGQHREIIEIPEWFGWRKRTAEVDVYDDVVLLVTISNDAKSRKRHTRHVKLRPGSVLLKYFRDIARTDLNVLFPDVRVVMGLKDQLWLGVPAVIGLIPIIIKLASTLTVLFVVAMFYLGVAGDVKEADTAGAIAALTALVALGGFCFRQWTKFQRQSLLYQKILSENVYFRNVNNNAGIFDYIIGEAEEQECKEAFLAYCFLLAGGGDLTEETLDARIEPWLRSHFGIDIDFECADALTKLDRLGLLQRDGGRLSVPPLDDALQRLDRIWDNFFPFNGRR